MEYRVSGRPFKNKMKQKIKRTKHLYKKDKFGKVVGKNKILNAWQDSKGNLYTVQYINKSYKFHLTKYCHL